MSLLRVRRSRPLEGRVSVPGDKSLAQRLLLLAAIAEGSSEILGLPDSGDVRSMVSCLLELRPNLGPELQAWNSNPEVRSDPLGFTSDGPRPRPSIRVLGGGRRGITAGGRPIDCGNSGTAMRLLTGVLASVPGSTSLIGDASLSRRPMERVARPLRAMGAAITTTDGHAPMTVTGGPLVGVRVETDVPSAQVKGAVLLAGLGAEGVTEVVEHLVTRDHTERLLHALGVIEALAPIVRAAEIPAFRAEVPGDPSGTAFLATAALATDGSVRVVDVGLNPTRTGFLDLLRRMGADVDVHEERTSLGEPIGTVEIQSGSALRGIDVSAQELVGAIDEVPALALLAARADGTSTFRGVAELRVKESDRVAAIIDAVRGLGGQADTAGDDLVVVGGSLEGGVVDARGDHRIAMAAAAVALGSRGGAEIRDSDAMAVSFPGFTETLRCLGADVEG